MNIVSRIIRLLRILWASKWLPVVFVFVVAIVPGVLLLGNPQWHRWVYQFQLEVKCPTLAESDLVPPKDYTGIWIQWRRWPSSHRKREVRFSRGAADGRVVEYYPSGAKRVECHFVQGVLDGRRVEWGTDGEVVVDGLYRAGRPWQGTINLLPYSSVAQLNEGMGLAYGYGVKVTKYENGAKVDQVRLVNRDRH